AAYSALFSASGGGKRNCDGLVSTQGVIEANCGPAPEANTVGVGRHTPVTAAPRNGGGGGRNPSVNRPFQIASATVCPHAIPALIESAFSSDASARIEASRFGVSGFGCPRGGGYK